MRGDTKTPDSQPDDIDLLALLERSILFFKKYKWIFLAAILLGLLLGFLRYRSLPRLYKSRLILHSIVLTNQNDIQIVANWNALLKSGGYAELAADFNCREDILPKVKQIKAEEIQKVFTPTNPNGFTIDVLVTDNSVLEELQQGIVYGFDNSEYVKDRLLTKRNRLQELIAKTSAEIKRLDSTKKMVETILSGKGASSSSLIVDASGISRQLIEMNEKLLSFREDLKFANSVLVLQSFSKFKNPVGPNLFVWLFLGLASCLSIAYLYALFNSTNQKLKRRSHLRKET